MGFLDILFPKESRYFDLFEQSAALMKQAAQELWDLLEDLDELEEKLDRMKRIEHEADEVMRQVETALSETFITPFDREDMSALIVSLDDVTDGIWAAAARLDIYKVAQPTKTAFQLSFKLVEQATRLQVALPLLRKRGSMPGVAQHTQQIDRLEHEADDIFREGLRELASVYPTAESARGLVVWKDVYERLEIATDRAKHAARIIDGIVMKHV